MHREKSFRNTTPSRTRIYSSGVLSKFWANVQPTTVHKTESLGENSERQARKVKRRVEIEKDVVRLGSG